MSNREYTNKFPKTSSEIISEAKAALNPPLYVKPLTTNRPFTPRERVFFSHRRTNRPPSAFKLQNVHFMEKKKNSSCTKLPALDKPKYYTSNNYYKKDVKRQTQSSPPNTTRRRSNSDVANNTNISRKKISSLSFPLSIDALLKMVQERLESILMIFVEQEMATNLDFEEVIEEFKNVTPAIRRLEL